MIEASLDRHLGLCRGIKSRVFWALIFSLTFLAFLPATSAHAIAPPHFVGLQSFDDPTTNQLLKVQRARVTEFRMVINWRAVEPTKPRCYGRESCHNYRFARYHQIFDRAAQKGVRILPVLMGSPEWANRDVRWPPSGTLARGSYYDFAAAVTRRYGANGSFCQQKTYSNEPALKANSLQIWNEPNLRNYWNNAPNPEAYANLLRGAARKAKDADAATRIIAAGLPWGTGIKPEDFLRRMFRWNGGAVKNYVNAVAVHPYARTPDLIPQAVLSARRALNEVRWYRAIWITEMGWATGKPDGRFQVSESTQAAYLRDSMNRLIAVKDRYNLDRAYWFNLSDVAGTNWYYRTGLVRRDGTHKPSYPALKRVTGAP